MEVLIWWKCNSGGSATLVEVLCKFGSIIYQHYINHIMISEAFTILFVFFSKFQRFFPTFSKMFLFQVSKSFFKFQRFPHFQRFFSSFKKCFQVQRFFSHVFKDFFFQISRIFPSSFFSTFSKIFFTIF